MSGILSAERIATGGSSSTRGLIPQLPDPLPIGNLTPSDSFKLG